MGLGKGGAWGGRQPISSGFHCERVLALLDAFPNRPAAPYYYPGYAFASHGTARSKGTVPCLAVSPCLAFSKRKQSRVVVIFVEGNLNPLPPPPIIASIPSHPIHPIRPGPNDGFKDRAFPWNPFSHPLRDLELPSPPSPDRTKKKGRARPSCSLKPRPRPPCARPIAPRLRPLVPSRPLPSAAARGKTSSESRLPE